MSLKLSSAWWWTLAAVAGLLVAVWATRERSREADKNAVIKLESDRLEAATELRRGFEAWQTGNATAAVDHLSRCSAMDPGLADALAGRWLLARLHGEHDMLLAPANPLPSRPDLYCVACSRDGRVVAAGGGDGRLFIRRLDADGGATGPPLVIYAHDEINDVAISPDGLRVASAGEDGRLRLWNIADGSVAREAYQGPEPLFAAAFSPSGSLLAIKKCPPLPNQSMSGRCLAAHLPGSKGRSASSRSNRKWSPSRSMKGSRSLGRST